MKRNYLVGITGGSGSGKTYFLNKLMEKLGEEQACLISQDNYYRNRKEQPIDTQGVTNFDTPQSIDHEALYADVKSLSLGNSFQRQEYTFNNPDRVPKMLVFEPKPIVIIEGLFVFYFEPISSLFDLKVFIDAQYHIKIKRRIMRDNIERGYNLDDVLYRYENHVVPAFEKYVAPFKQQADIVVPNNRNCDNAIDVLVNHLKSKMNG